LRRRASSEKLYTEAGQFIARMYIVIPAKAGIQKYLLTSAGFAIRSWLYLNGNDAEFPTFGIETAKWRIKPEFS
jgi:hypothetical protein